MVPFAITPEELEKDVQAYRQARVARLTAERGWLTLVGKVWLGDGQHTLGADAHADIVLPEGRAPARLGTVTVEAGIVRLDVEGEAKVFARGQPVRSLELRSDAAEAPDDVVVGSLTLQLLQRGNAFALRIRDAESAARKAFPGIPSYAVDPGWRIVARLEAFASAREMAIEDGDGRLQSYRCPGIAHFEKDGQPASLLPLFENRDERLFVLFSDRTSRDETYGAGRFLYAPPPQEGRVLLDFNKAFNPPCAFTAYAVCPLPPPENKLELRIEAGEKRPLSY
ncbi:MAG TPA: DUF1684 domain-containing protein [Polyangiaceae bacterium]|nr:DUF1684 domain-containing protein [Polyangiaceae bacterium]